MQGKFLVIALSTTWLALAGESPVAFGDGGAMRFSERRGDRLITLFTAPTPLRAGPVDISVLVQDADSGRPLLDVPIVVHAHPIYHAARGKGDCPFEDRGTVPFSGRISAPATAEAATNKLLRAARLELSESGRWHVEVVVQDGQGPPIGFDVEVAEAPPPWLHMSLWIGWPLLAIGFFAIHQVRVQRRQTTTSRFTHGNLVLPVSQLGQ